MAKKKGKMTPKIPHKIITKFLVFCNPDIMWFIDSYGMIPKFYQTWKKLEAFQKTILINKTSSRNLNRKHVAPFAYFSGVAYV